MNPETLTFDPFRNYEGKVISGLPRLEENLSLLILVDEKVKETALCMVRALMRDDEVIGNVRQYL